MIDDALAEKIISMIVKLTARCDALELASGSCRQESWDGAGEGGETT